MAAISQSHFQLIRRLLIGFAALGAVFFAGLFSLTFASQDMIERSGQSFIRYQIAKEVKQANAAMESSPYAEQLDFLKDRFSDESERVQLYLSENLDEKIAAALAKLYRLDCDKKQSLRDSLREGWEARLDRIGVSAERVENLIQGKYLSILAALKTDLRIFLGTNTILFFLVAIILFLKKRASVHLVLPAALLLVSTMIAICLYIFGQNWFYAILYSDFWGLSYGIYIAVIFALLLDITINRGRITSFIFNGISQILGSSVNVTAC